jgi:hypothetical protein
MAGKRRKTTVMARREVARVRLRRLNRERASLLELFPDLQAKSGRSGPKTVKISTRRRR